MAIRHSRGFDTDAAFAHLAKRDRKLGTWMKRLGPIAADPRWRKPFDPVDALARAILYQQLSGKAASTIVGRVETAIGSDRFHCDTLARIDDAGLRACGVSGNKTLALRDLAMREERGEIPTLRRMSTLDEDAIVAADLPLSCWYRMARASASTGSKGLRQRGSGAMGPIRFIHVPSRRSRRARWSRAASVSKPRA